LTSWIEDPALAVNSGSRFRISTQGGSASGGKSGMTKQESEKLGGVDHLNLIMIKYKAETAKNPIELD